MLFITSRSDRRSWTEVDCTSSRFCAVMTREPKGMAVLRPASRPSFINYKPGGKMGTECSEGMRRYATLGLLAASALLLAACGGGGGEGSMTQTGQSADIGTDGRAVALAVKPGIPRAVCGPNDHPESGLQGQVPKFLRTRGGFSGFNCNLELVGQAKGDGAGWQHAFFQDAAGHRCSYHDTRFATTRPKQGTVVIDVSDNTNPVPTAYLTTRPMLDPWESLKVNERRQILGAEDGRNGTGTAQLDLYDISGDCRFP